MSFLEDIKNSIIGACMLASFVTMFIVTCFVMVGIILYSIDYLWPGTLISECPTERLVLDCADELVEEFIADHPDVCDGLVDDKAEDAMCRYAEQICDISIDYSGCIYADRSLCR